MATLATQSVSTAGLAPSYASAAGGGDKCRPGEHTFLHVVNGGGGSINVTVNDPNSQNPGNAASFNPDLVVAVGAGANKMIGPLKASRFRDASDGLVAISYSGVSSVTVAVIAA